MSGSIPPALRDDMSFADLTTESAVLVGIAATSSRPTT